MDIDDIIKDMPNRIVPVKYEITDTGCLVCTSHTKNKDGYFDFSINNKRYLLHRYIYEKINGGIDSDSVVRHTCDNSSCINPDHLKIGTHEDNVKDRCIRGRSAKGDKHGRSKLTEEQVLEIRNDNITSISKLATEYGVSRKAIRSIKQYKNWSWLK